MDLKLKRCPFCGESADLLYSQVMYGYFIYCKCSVCSAQSRTFSFARTELDENGDFRNSISAVMAAEAWNRRCTDAEQDH